MRCSVEGSAIKTPQGLENEMEGSIGFILG